MPQETLTIVNQKGLHARAAAKFVNTVERFDAEVTVCRRDMTANGGSIMGLMMLGAAKGTTITVAATGIQAQPALQAIRELVESRFGEEV